MDSDVYRKIKREYDIKRQQKLEAASEKKVALFEKHPKLKSLEDEIHALAIQTTRLILNADEITRQVEQENLGLKLECMEKKIEKELQKLGIQKQELEPKYDCKLCKDTGMIKKGDMISYCNCFMQAIINATYVQSNMTKLEEENFETFDICYYSNKKDKEKYGIEKSPMENIDSIKKVSQKFCEQIAETDQKNLLFTGNTGLGKTFLANAIAKEVIKQGKTVVYQTAPILMDKVIEYKFSYDKKGILKEQYDKIFEVDLLIIDDLGTETMSNIKFTELFNIINTRLLKNKKILISTNLTLNQLYKEYDERVISRIIGNFTICKFIGEDIRLKKKRMPIK